MNEQFKGTPGPWLRDGQDNGAQWNIDDTEGFAVGMSFQRPFDKSYVERTANANLIAAAPDLLEALRGVMSMFPVIDDDESGRMGFTEDARNKLNAGNDAINKALGKGADE